ncbi:MAG: efflux RND transporter permease subunit, partial [Candidatus Latescibacteria bacterium]|nr:efflux RND transporter permease subunit [Candidatus Latescibacterota bacterium]
MKISEYAIKKPITTVMATLSLVVMGFISLFRLPVEYAPDLQYPRMYVSYSYPSSSPEEIERKITKPIEDMLGTIPGVESLRARSYDSRGYVFMEFDYGTDMDLKSIHVRDRMDQVRSQLPDDLERIEMRRWDSSDWEILDYNMTWMGDDESELAVVYKNTILPRLQRVPGVGNVEMEGADERVLNVDVDQNRMRAYGLDIRTLNRTIRNNNINISGGYVTDGGKRLAVRAVGEFDDVDQIRNLELSNGLQIQDVAKVSYDYPEKRYFERMDGRAAVSMEIRKTSTANLVETCRLVKAEIEAIQNDVGRDKLRLHLRRDRSIDVTAGINSLGQSAIMGGMLAIAVIFVFLRNFRSTLIVGSAIPISVLCVFMIMYLMRQIFGSSITLNMISMMGLMVAIGMLVDPAVVALENIFRKRFDEGEPIRSAAIEGSREIGVPVLAAALTTICVFVPLIFMTGSYNTMWMRDFAITVCISVVAALCVALTLIPLACSRAFSTVSGQGDLFLKVGLGTLFGVGATYLIYTVGVGESATWLKDKTLWLLDGLSAAPMGVWGALGLFVATIVGVYFRFRHIGTKAVYARVIGATLHYRWTTVVVSTVILFAGIHIFTKIEVQRYRYQPDRMVAYSIEIPKTYDIDDALVLYKQIEAILVPHKEELDIEAIKTRFSNRRGNSIYMYLKPAEESQLSTDDIKKKVGDLLPKDIPGVRFKAGFSRGGSSGTGVGVELKGRNQDVLAILAEDIRLRMDDIPGIHDVETSLE